MTKAARAILPIATLLLSLAAVSCRDSEPGSADNNTRYDWVTYMAPEADGSVMTFQNYEDSPLITLHAPGYAGENLKKGQRLLIGYNIDERTTDTQWRVTMRYASKLIFDSLRTTDAATLASRESEPIELTSIWRTGDFINIDCKVQYTGESRRFYLIADKATLDNETVDVYLIDDILGKEGSFYRRAYASFYIGAAWHRASCRRVILHLNDTRYPERQSYEFSK